MSPKADLRAAKKGKAPANPPLQINTNVAAQAASSQPDNPQTDDLPANDHEGLLSIVVYKRKVVYEPRWYNEILRFGRDHLTFKYMAYIVAQTMRAIQTDHVAQHMADIAMKVVEAYNHGRTTNRLPDYTQSAAIEYVKGRFSCSLRRQFPPIYIDDSLHSAYTDAIGLQCMEDWSLDYAHGWAVLVKSDYLRLLAHLGKNPLRKNEFQALLAYLTEVMLHEIGGHYLRWCVSRGRMGQTPVSLRTRFGEESGFYLELNIHPNATISLIKHGHGVKFKHEAFAPYLHRPIEDSETHEIAWISPETIKKHLGGSFNYPLADQWTPFEGRVEFKPTEHDWDDPEHGPTPGAEISGQSSESSDDSASYPHPQKPSKEKPHWMEWVPIKKTSADGKVLRPHIVVTRDNAKVFGVPFDDTPKVDLDPETFEDAQIDPYADIAGPIEDHEKRGEPPTLFPKHHPRSDTESSDGSSSHPPKKMPNIERPELPSGATSKGVGMNTRNTRSAHGTRKHNSTTQRDNLSQADKTPADYEEDDHEEQRSHQSNHGALKHNPSTQRGQPFGRETRPALPVSQSVVERFSPSRTGSKPKA